MNRRLGWLVGIGCAAAVGLASGLAIPRGPIRPQFEEPDRFHDVMTGSVLAKRGRRRFAPWVASTNTALSSVGWTHRSGRHI